MKCGDKQKEQQIWIESLINTGNSTKHKQYNKTNKLLTVKKFVKITNKNIKINQEQNNLTR